MWFGKLKEAVLYLIQLCKFYLLNILVELSRQIIHVDKSNWAKTFCDRVNRAGSLS